jgi:hypothetical protein
VWSGAVQCSAVQCCAVMWDVLCQAARQEKEEPRSSEAKISRAVLSASALPFAACECTYLLLSFLVAPDEWMKSLLDGLFMIHYKVTLNLEPCASALLACR